MTYMLRSLIPSSHIINNPNPPGKKTSGEEEVSKTQEPPDPPNPPIPEVQTLIWKVALKYIDIRNKIKQEIMHYLLQGDQIQLR